MTAAPARRPRVACLILNFDRPNDTLACLASLAAGDYPHYDALVLDAGADDRLAAPLAAQFPRAIRLPLAENSGYAGNNNVGLRHPVAQAADWVFLLNDDTTLAPDALSQLIAVGEQDSSAGLLGPTILYANEPALIQSAGGQLGPRWQATHRGRNESDHGQYREPQQREWLSGGALLARRQMIEQVGELDERYFMYWEEIDWCLRAARAGGGVVQVPAAHAWHQGRPPHEPSPAVTYYSARNRLLLLSRFGAPEAARLGAWLEYTRTLLSWSLRPRWRGQRAHRDALWQALADYRGRRWGKRALR